LSPTEDKPSGSRTNSPEQASEPVGEDFSRVVANLTHELKTPLHAILAVASILQSEADGALSEEQHKQVDIIQRNGGQLLDLINELLQFSSTSTVTRSLNLRKLSLPNLLNNILESIEVVAAKKNVRVVSDIQKVSRTFVSDATLLHRIFGNLLSNAVKFSLDDGEVFLFAESTQDGTLKVQISDTGIGMSPEVLHSVFREFYQVEAGDTRSYGGVGLGLALVRTSLELLKGTMEVKSEPGQGSLFTLTIPSAEGVVVKRRILFLDRDATVRLTLKECFESEGYETHMLAESDALIQAIAEFQPNLLLMDIEGPNMHNLKLVEEIRGSTWGKSLPILLMSVLDGPEERARGFAAGANDLIVKPFDVTELLARVRSQLERPW
jgi:CheY-like chemotaxis protein/two-component sensor histidine kinase